MRAATLLRAAVLVPAAAFALLPFYWMALVSLTQNSEMTTLSNPWLPDPQSSLANYAQLLASAQFGRWMLNTVAVTGGTVIIAVAASLAAAHAIAGLGPRRGAGLATALLASYALPQTVLALPLLVMMSRLHLANTVAALILAYPGLVIPFGTWALWSLLSRDAVRELLEQARIEGARPVPYVMQVLLPAAMPVLAVVAIFGVAIVFNDYLYLFTLITGDGAATVMAGVETTNVDAENPGYDFAAMLLGAGPLAAACAWLADRYAGSLGGATQGG